MCRFSIIVPMLGELGPFEDTLASVLRHRPENSQIIVVHDDDYRDPYCLSGEVSLIAAGTKPDIIQCFNIGMCYANGSITIFIRPGVELDENWDAPVEDAFESPRIGSVTPVIVNSHKPSKILVAGVRADSTFTRRLVGIGKGFKPDRTRTLLQTGPTSWLAAYRTKVLKSLAPFDERLAPSFLDLDLALSLQRLGFKSEISCEFLGYVESDQAILAETISPHGQSAQRALRRHGQNNVPQNLRNCMVELAQSPFAVWKLKHLFQRMSAGRMKTIDRKFSIELDRLRDSENWFETEPSHLWSHQNGVRRAA